MTVYTYSPPRYTSDVERREARRATWRRSARRRYQAYRALCAELGVPSQKHWTTHHRELRVTGWVAAAGVEVTVWHRWWLDRFSREEIRELGCGLIDGAVRATKEV